MGAPVRAGELDTQIAELESYLKKTDQGAPASSTDMGSSSLEEMPKGKITTTLNNAATEAPPAEENNSGFGNIISELEKGLANFEDSLTGYAKGLTDFPMR